MIGTRTLFQILPVGAHFMLNGNVALKQSTRTCRYPSFGRTFYVGRNESVLRIFEKGDTVTTPNDGEGIVFQGASPGWDRVTVDIADAACPGQRIYRDFYPSDLNWVL